MENKGMKILAIDKNKDNLAILKALIGERFPDISFFTAGNGVDGLMIAALEDPDIIILDILMPEMDGYEICTKMKGDKKLSDIPVVFITALKDEKENRIKALEVGAEAFLSKPINETELTAQIRAMLKIRKANLEKRNEKARLAEMVRHRTHQLESELSKQKKTEESLRISEARHKTLYEQRTEIIQDLIKAKEKAQESDRLKSAFLANMSHEIRTPMNGIIGFAQLLNEPNLSENQQKKFVDIIIKSGDRMLNIINDLINISKIESGLMEIDPSIISINELMNYLHEFFIPEIQKRKTSVKLIQQIPEKDVTTYTDREKLTAVLTNLIKNAIKFTHKGSIEYGYTLADKQLYFFVKDTGIGIPKNKQEAIFKRFVQADLSIAGPYEGAGLGLSIAKAYIEELGGNIWVESTQGHGATFHFTLPLTLKDETSQNTDSFDLLKQEQINTSDKRLYKMLIVEDDESSDLLLTMAMNDLSSEIIHVKTGTKAIDMCREHNDIDLIFMDIKMPDMNGYEATRRIREFNKNVVIIAQTAYALTGEREKALNAGCNDYLSKPICRGRLLESVNNNLKNYNKPKPG